MISHRVNQNFRQNPPVAIVNNLAGAILPIKGDHNVLAGIKHIAPFHLQLETPNRNRATTPESIPAHSTGAHENPPRTPRQDYVPPSHDSPAHQCHTKGHSFVASTCRPATVSCGDAQTSPGQSNTVHTIVQNARKPAGGTYVHP
jgi:hypothetical protein